MLHLDLGERTKNSSRSLHLSPEPGWCLSYFMNPGSSVRVCVSEGLGFLPLTLARFRTCPQPPTINTKFSRKLLWGTPKTELFYLSQQTNKHQKKKNLPEGALLCFSVSPKHQKVSAPTHSYFLLCSISVASSSQPPPNPWRRYDSSKGTHTTQVCCMQIESVYCLCCLQQINKYIHSSLGNCVQREFLYVALASLAFTM